jgi:hypothetical protein
MRTTVTAIMLLGALSLTGCSIDSQRAAQVATPPVVPTPVASAVTQSPPVPSPQRSRPVEKPTHRITLRTSAAQATGPTCGAPANPYGLNLCRRGNHVYGPPADVCTYFACIPNFPNGHGYMVQCNDGMFSMSGGRRGTCSHHSGEGRPVFQG